MDKPASALALRLEELGFKKVPSDGVEGHVKAVQAMVESAVGKLSRRDRRRLASFIKSQIKEQASFTISKFPGHPVVTEATDDAGQMWECEGSVDLKPFGFLDNAEWMLEHLKSKKSALN